MSLSLNPSTIVLGSPLAKQMQALLAAWRTIFFGGHTLAMIAPEAGGKESRGNDILQVALANFVQFGLSHTPRSGLIPPPPPTTTETKNSTPSPPPPLEPAEGGGNMVFGGGDWGKCSPTKQRCELLRRETHLQWMFFSMKPVDGWGGNPEIWRRRRACRSSQRELHKVFVCFPRGAKEAPQGPSLKRDPPRKTPPGEE